MIPQNLPCWNWLSSLSVGMCKNSRQGVAGVGVVVVVGSGSGGMVVAAVAVLLLLLLVPYFTGNTCAGNSHQQPSPCRELQDLSERLTNDGRDALASLQRELEAEEEKRLAEERGNLKEALARESLRC